MADNSTGGGGSGSMLSSTWGQGVCGFCGGWHPLNYCPQTTQYIKTFTTLSGSSITLTPDPTVVQDITLRWKNTTCCPKCETDNAALTVRFCKGAPRPSPLMAQNNGCVWRADYRDHLHIKCPRCSYEWELLASDAPEWDDDGTD